MPFPAHVKLEAKRRSAFRCCLCYAPFVEVHHIVPAAEHGPDTLDNAAPLCARCHDLFGGNPEKRKQIREMRDHWWDLMREREHRLAEEQAISDWAMVAEDPDGIKKLGRGVAIYHMVLPDENFETAASMLVQLVHTAQKKMPGSPRYLYLDIEGHRKSDGQFDHDMWELQSHFILGFLGDYLSSIKLPLIAAKSSRPQRNDVPEQIQIFKDDSTLQKRIMETDEEQLDVYVGDTWRRLTIKRS
jgi:hypothetical protein